ncbi:hypothetical protein [Methylobacterium iners]|uniref:hypothetical protein n=1 Tax=Methylobacterium iners TaxID=418707 RepID=UPI0035A22ECC
MLIADLPTYGYRRVHALLRRQAEREGQIAPNVKRVDLSHEGARPPAPAPRRRGRGAPARG